MNQLPTLEQLISMMTAQPAITLDLEAQAYSSIIKATETAEHFGRCYRELGPTLLAYGRKIGRDLPPIEVAAPDGDAPVVGFVIHSAALLAHTTRLIDFLAGSPTRIRPIIYCLSGYDATFEKAMCGFKVRFIKSTPLKTLLDLRCYSEIDHVQAMVFVSLPLWLHTAAAMKIAPKLVWWCMKYHNLYLPELDGQLSGHPLFHKFYEFGGISFRCVHSAVMNLFDPSLASEAAELRTALLEVHDVTGPIYGVMVREEKYTRDYINAVAEILRRNPQAMFLYTGHKAPVEVAKWIAEEGIEARCKFAGWVDTKLYAQVIDIYLDTFPMPSGQCAFEVMAAGKPILVLDTPEARESSVLSVALPLRDRPVWRQMTPEQRNATVELLKSLQFAPHTGHYANVASMLATDEEMRSERGVINQDFVDAILQDQPRYVQTVEDHLLEIIQGAAALAPPPPPKEQRPARKGARRTASAAAGRKPGARSGATPRKPRKKKKPRGPGSPSRKGRTGKRHTPARRKGKRGGG